MSKILHLSSKYIYNSILDNSNKIEKIYSKLHDIYFEQTGYTSKPYFDNKLGIVFDNENGIGTKCLISNYDTNFNLLDNDFHIEFWIKINESYGYNELFSRVNSGETSYKIMYIDELTNWTSNSLTLALSNNGTTWDKKIVVENVSDYLTFKKETHISVFRNDDQINITINGILRKQYDLPTDYTIYSNDSGVQLGSYDVDEYVTNPTKPRGKILSDTSTLANGSYPVNGDTFPVYSTYGTIGSMFQYESDTEQRIWTGFYSTNNGVYEYNITTNTGFLLSDITTASGGIHQVNGDALPQTRVKSITYNHITNKLYVGMRGYIWEYDYATNTGYSIPDSYLGIFDWRELNIDTDINRLYGANYDSGILKYFDLNIDYTIHDIPINNGDTTGAVHLNQVSLNNQKSKIATTTAGRSPDWAWLYDIPTGNGKLLSYANTNTGGIYEVIGDAAPYQDAEKAIWFVDISGNSVLVIGYWGDGIWFYDEQNNTGKLLTTTSTNIGGNYEVIGDALPHNTIYNMTQLDNILYIGTNSGMWIYNPLTNVAKNYTVTSTSSGGDYEVNGDALTSNLNRDTYTSYVAKFGNTIYKPIDGNATVWVNIDFSSSYLNGNIDELIMYNGITGSTPYNPLGYILNDQIFIPTLRNNSSLSTYKQILQNNLLQFTTFALSSKSIGLENYNGNINICYNLVNGNDFVQTELTNMPLLDINEGIAFGGTNDYLDGGSGSIYDIGTGTFHFECWAKYNSVTTDGTLLNISNGVHVFRELNFGFSTNGMNIIQSNNIGTANNTINLTMALNANTWYHIILSRDEDDNEFIIIDGILRKKVENTTFVLEGTDLWIGWYKRLQSTSRNLDGNMDNIQLLNINKYNVINKNEGDRIINQLPPRESENINDHIPDPVEEPDYFTLTLNVNNTTITLPHLIGYNYDYWVDWGDGNDNTVTSYNDSNRSHTYSYTGSVDVKISGVCETLYVDFTDSSNLKTTLTEIKSWGISGGLKRLRLYHCDYLVDLPSGTTEKGRLSNIETFNYSFGQCILLSSIPSGLFDNSLISINQSFYAAFLGCDTITTIPSGLFDDCVNVSTEAFNATFQNCELLSNIPDNLFDNCTGVTGYGGFRATFVGTSITSIPTDLFRYNTLVGNNAFDKTFKDCLNLTSVPEQLFKYNTLAITNGFAETFYNCTKLTLNPWIWYAPGEEDTRFLNQSVSFSYCFDRSSWTGSQGTAPDLWNCDFGTGTPVTNDCWAGAGNSISSLSNYGSIPEAWK